MECWDRSLQPGQGPTATWIKVSRLFDNGGGCFDVGTEVPDAVGTAQTTDGSFELLRMMKHTNDLCFGNIKREFHVQEMMQFISLQNLFFIV